VNKFCILSLSAVTIRAGAIKTTGLLAEAVDSLSVLVLEGYDKSQSLLHEQKRVVPLGGRAMMREIIMKRSEEWGRHCDLLYPFTLKM